MHHLAHTAFLTASITNQIPFIGLFWSWMEYLLMLGCHPLSAAIIVSHSKISVFNPSYISLTVSWMDVDSDIMTCGFEPPVTVASNRSTGYSLQLKYDGTR